MIPVRKLTTMSAKKIKIMSTSTTNQPVYSIIRYSGKKASSYGTRNAKKTIRTCINSSQRTRQMLVGDTMKGGGLCAATTIA
mmetsp:Transcript_112122/g.298007  ORF Transcript_112122/g.298007 Transcript_112122/m.298007 type:complete len:82 (+) Transcript_112122:113-358(+)